jgi:hypothetical protein
MDVSDVSAQMLTDVDLLIVNIQGLRGRRIIESIQNVLRARGPGRATLIIASSPCDVLSLNLDALIDQAHVRTLGSAPLVNDVSVAKVGDDRALAQRGFEFAVEELRGKFENNRLIDLAKSAWWATRQTVDGDRHEPEMQRFINALERLEQSNPDGARLMSHGRKVLQEAVDNKEIAEGRRRAVTEAAIYTTGNSGTLVITRGLGVTRLRNEIAEQLELPADSLHELGVRVQTHNSFPPAEPTDVAVIAGYYGLATIDAMLACQAARLKLVFDPIESRAAWFGVQKIIRCLRNIGAEEAIPALEKLAAAIAEGIPANLRSQVDDVILSSGFFDPFCTLDSHAGNSNGNSPAGDETVTICLADGTSLDVRLNSHFDVLPPMGGKLRTVTARMLVPGDEIILLEEGERTLFSDQLMRTLDEGVLKDPAREREMWLLLVKSVYSAHRPNVRGLYRELNELGYSVSYRTVLSWVSFTDNRQATAPRHRALFLAFAGALGLTLPEPDLLAKYTGIKKWRAGHRVAGRNLARAIRAAYLGRLDAVSQERLKREWGVDAFKLVKSARLAIVDEVLLPEGEKDAAK